jgi:hypothetical protein
MVGPAQAAAVGSSVQINAATVRQRNSAFKKCVVLDMEVNKLDSWQDIQAMQPRQVRVAPPGNGNSAHAQVACWNLNYAACL